jgi:putative transposase
MLKNHHLAQAIGDVGFAKFRRQLTYKAAWYGCQVIVVSRWEPSSKACSHCCWINDQLTLADRTFHCQACGQVIDRDLNAAINLANLVKLADSSSASRNACGEDGAGQGHVALVKLSSMKQEPDTFDASA